MCVAIQNLMPETNIDGAGGGALISIVRVRRELQRVDFLSKKACDQRTKATLRVGQGKSTVKTRPTPLHYCVTYNLTCKFRVLRIRSKFGRHNALVLHTLPRPDFERERVFTIAAQQHLKGGVLGVRS